MLTSSRPRSLFAAATLLGALVTAGTLAPGEALAPARETPPAAETVAGAYIVVMSTPPPSTSGRGPTALRTAVRAATEAGADVTSRYSSVLVGFAARLDAAALRAVRALPAVAYVEPDTQVHATELSAARRVNQESPPWGLDRIDERTRPLDNRYRVSADGSGATVYVVDTGIRRTHRQFGRRVKPGYATGLIRSDCNGHGTHVAGTIGGRRYGVAKKVALVPVRVLGCGGSGTTSGVISGLDWVADNAARTSVVNMSLGGPRSRALDSAVKRLVRRGISVVVAAGNEGRDACRSSPARVRSAITVGATNRRDRRAGFSNRGRCVDLYAPGVDIRSAWFLTDTSTEVLSGTSMASPHVAGVVALYRDEHPRAGPGKAARVLRAQTTRVRHSELDLLYARLPGLR